MIRQRYSELGDAVNHAVEKLRAARPLEKVAPAVLELLATAANSERASYWAVEPALMQLRVIAAWSAVGVDASIRERHARPRNGPLGSGPAGSVWRTGKPLWSACFVLDASLPSTAGSTWQGGVWFAVKSDTTVYGIVELLGRALHPNTPDDLFMLERLGIRLGQVLEEVLHGKAAAALNRRFFGGWPTKSA
jgi:hypothetical protein